MNKTSIEWTHRPGTVGMTWNPIHFRRFKHGDEPAWPTGNMCTRISPGCKNCYAEKINERWGNRLSYAAESLGYGEFYLDEKELQAPLRMKNPATIFVGDMFDLFHEAIPENLIGEVLRVAWKLPRHTFQFLTKRAERMYEIISQVQMEWIYPGQHLWFGVSVEDAKRAIERIPILRATPAVIRFLSVEPQLEFIDAGQYLSQAPPRHSLGNVNWVICGGESGPHARPFNLAWAESLREQCKQAGVAYFFKQGGSNAILNGERLNLSGKGGDPAEWPEHLRVREFPAELPA